jgi:DtxR family Mn-dependent transcriptional regulator
MLTYTEENYLKALLRLSTMEPEKEGAGTNELAANLGVKPATANDMLKRLKEKKLIDYEKYGKISLTRSGRKYGIEVLRKHRLWETFLSEKLGFSWDEVHEVAEQLEHIHSEKLINSLDKYLGFPKFDPHGDAIPGANGEMKKLHQKTLSEAGPGIDCKMTGVKDNTSAFLQYVEKTGLSLNCNIRVISRQTFDKLMEIEVNKKIITVSQKFAENIYVGCKYCIKGKSCSKTKCEIL